MREYKNKRIQLIDRVSQTLNGKGSKEYIDVFSNPKGYRYTGISITEKKKGDTNYLRFDIGDEKYGCVHITELSGYQIEDVLNNEEQYTKMIKELKKDIRSSVLSLHDDE